MTTYANKNHSGIYRFSEGEDYMLVWFNSNQKHPYKYSYDSAGIKHVEKMRMLARKGKGLNTYISRYVKDLYEK
jgi:hypothetical protein